MWWLHWDKKMLDILDNHFKSKLSSILKPAWKLWEYIQFICHAILHTSSYKIPFWKGFISHTVIYIKMCPETEQALIYICVGLQSGTPQWNMRYRKGGHLEEGLRWQEKNT